VQGVGFRPFVHRLAVRCSIAGSVRNESGEVRIEAEGRSDDVQRFISALHAEAPPLARIDGIDITPAALRVLPGFQVMPSLVEGAGRLPVSPDVAICEACRTELFDATNRRYRYPFITCTDCGPRFTVIESMPYDRERTSMRAFAQCGACRREYESPLDRRYHSETNSCPACGPAVWLESPTQPGRRSNHGAEAIAGAASRLLRGEIVAIRGLGGFHLAADATNEAAVARLRERKAREAKPLALMVATLEDARRLAFISAGEQEWLTSPERPIVVVRARPGNGIASRVSPGLDSIGIVLAYTPLHLLLLEQTDRPLIMTSGNRSDEPIATGNAEAARRLGGVADAFILHDREIVARYDDSVVRVADDTRIILRRARGYAPLPIALPVPSPLPLLAVGPHLKNTFTLAEGERAFVSQHIGDLENLETLEHFHAALARFRDLFRITPRAVVRDRHPGYLSTRVAEELGIARVIAVQHHHAHIAAVAAEHGRAGRVVGLAFDGTGYGDDGLVWGAEALVADLLDFTRVGQLRYAPLPGGDLAARRPWRAALGFLSLEPAAAPAFARALQPVRAAERSAAEAQIARRINAPLASSMGRLFDAAAAVLGLRHENRYEGQAAMELETLAGQHSAEPLPFPLLPSGEGWVMDPLPLLAALGERTIAGEAVEDLAARLHESVAATAAELAARICEAEQLDTVALGGGVFQNARLLVSTRRRLTDRGLDVLVPRELSPNDGAISYGQAAIAAAQLTAAC
jgi:hydrogenase maturation protein HypF